MFVIRWALDDSIDNSLAAAVDALHALIVCRDDEVLNYLLNDLMPSYSVINCHLVIMYSVCLFVCLSICVQHSSNVFLLYFDETCRYRLSSFILSTFLTCTTRSVWHQT